MDEVDLGTWTNEKDILDYMSTNNLTAIQLAQKFKDRVVQTVNDAKKKVMVWEEPILDFDLHMDPNTLIQVWRSFGSIKPIAEKGYKMVVSSFEYWYLDLGRQDIYTNGTYRTYTTWPNAYLYDPTSGLTNEQKDLVVGGEACMWAETANTHNVDALLWPRTAAVGERLWSSAEVSDVNNPVLKLIGL
jgi:hexosaminidase